MIEAHRRFAAAAGEVEPLAVGRDADEQRAPWANPAFRGFRLGPTDLAYYVDGIEIAHTQLADLLAPLDALPVRTRELVGADGGVAADLAIHRVQLWRSPGRGPQLVGLGAVVIWRP